MAHRSTHNVYNVSIGYPTKERTKNKLPLLTWSSTNRTKNKLPLLTWNSTNQQSILLRMSTTNTNNTSEEIACIKGPSFLKLTLVSCLTRTAKRDKIINLPSQKTKTFLHNLQHRKIQTYIGRSNLQSYQLSYNLNSMPPMIHQILKILHTSIGYQNNRKKMSPFLIKKEPKE